MFIDLHTTSDSTLCQGGVFSRVTRFIGNYWELKPKKELDQFGNRRAAHDGVDDGLGDAIGNAQSAEVEECMHDGIHQVLGIVRPGGGLGGSAVTSADNLPHLQTAARNQ